MASADAEVLPVPANESANVKKVRAPKGSKPPPAHAHPTYLQMITEAIVSLKNRAGSSQYAIAAYMNDKYKGHLPANYKKMLSMQLRKLANSGKVIRVKASFKLPPHAKAPLEEKKQSSKAAENSEGAVAKDKKQPTKTKTKTDNKNANKSKAPVAKVKKNQPIKAENKMQKAKVAVAVAAAGRAKPAVKSKKKEKAGVGGKSVDKHGLLANKPTTTSSKGAAPPKKCGPDQKKPRVHKVSKSIKILES